MMKRDEFVEVVRGFWKRQPFRPFVIVSDDGRRFVVTNPTTFTCYAGAATQFQDDDTLATMDYDEVDRVVFLDEVEQRSPA